MSIVEIRCDEDNPARRGYAGPEGLEREKKIHQKSCKEVVCIRGTKLRIWRPVYAGKYIERTWRRVQVVDIC